MNKFWNLCTLSQPAASGDYEVRIIEKGDPLSCPITTYGYYDMEHDIWIYFPKSKFSNHEVVAWRFINEKE